VSLAGPPGGQAAELQRGRAAYARKEWGPAYEALSRADAAGGLAGDDLRSLAMAAYLTGRDEAFQDALERAHRLYGDAGERAASARSAIWLGLHLAEHGEVARATGWFGRATRILDGLGADCVERGYLLLPRGLRHLAGGEYEEAAAVAAEAAGCAQEYGDRDLLALAVHLQGKALLRQGEVPEGLALLDEAMVTVSTDELSPQVTGLVYCSVISACRRVYALDRAHEWTEALTEWCEAQPDLVAFRGQCRVFRSELMRLRGSWQEALAEARRVGGKDADGDPIRGAALYEQAEVHRLRGELAAAEDAYRRASLAGRAPQPGLALLRLAQGDIDAAAASIRRALGETDAPLLRARILPAAVDIRLEAGDVDAADRSCGELEEIAESYGTAALRTMAAQARGAVALARDEPAEALEPLRRACREWLALGASHHAARARALLGRACRALGDEDAAAMELEAARTAFEELGATLDLAALDGARQSSPARHGLTPREHEVLGLVATGRTNRAIAEDLFISEKTVARHVSNIFRKLGLSSRAAATAYAYEHGLAGRST
jgi:DNA-binding NarL/FixJ family response regulator